MDILSKKIHLSMVLNFLSPINFTTNAECFQKYSATKPRCFGITLAVLKFHSANSQPQEQFSLKSCAYLCHILFNLLMDLILIIKNYRTFHTLNKNGNKWERALVRPYINI